MDGAGMCTGGTSCAAQLFTDTLIYTTADPVNYGVLEGFSLVNNVAHRNYTNTSSAHECLCLCQENPNCIAALRCAAVVTLVCFFFIKLDAQPCRACSSHCISSKGTSQTRLALLKRHI